MSEPLLARRELMTRPLGSMVSIDPESLPLGTNPSFEFHYFDISCAANGRLQMPDTSITYAEAPSRARRIIKNGDVLMSTVRPNLKAFAYCNLPEGGYVASTGFAVLRAIEGNDPRYILYSILSDDVARQIDSYVVGSNYPAINSSDVKRLQIPGWKPPQQRRIAEILSTMDEAIEQTEALIAKYQQIKAGLMHDLFTRGVTPDGHLRPMHTQAPHLFKESPLGWIPREWDVVRIADAFEIQLGKMLNKFAKTGKLSAPYLGNRAVQWDFVDISAIEVMDFNPYERQKFSLLPGDLLVCEGGDVGRTAMWRGEMDGCYYQKAIHRLRPKSADALPSFMLRFMRFARDNGFFREFTSQSSIAHLTQEKLGVISMLLPTKDEQRQIAERFDALDKIIQTEQSRLDKLHQQKHGLMHDLLTGRVRLTVV